MPDGSQEHLKRDDDEEDSRLSPEYMTTWGDMMTLLLCFFVFLYAISSLTKADIQEFKVILSVVQGSLGVLPTGHTVSERELMDGGVNVEKLSGHNPGKGELETTKARIEKKLGAMEKSGDISIYRDERGLVINITNELLFDLGNADIKKGSRVILDNVGVLLKEIPNSVMIEGHTDDIPLSPGGPFQDNWELSLARANNVLRYFQKVGKIDPRRLSSIGYAEYHPRSGELGKQTPEDRKLNRRVEIVILKGLRESF